MRVHNIIDKMEAAENHFLNTEFIAPVLPQGQVRVRIAGVICTLQVKGNPKPGWAFLKPLSFDQAEICGKPGLGQIKAYLELFPAVRLILLTRARHYQTAWPAYSDDSRFASKKAVRVFLAESAELFCQIKTRFDGVQFWFQETDRQRNPSVAAYLRAALAKTTKPVDLHKATLTKNEREAYTRVFEAVSAARRDTGEMRLSHALAHSGARLASYIERENAYTVSFEIDGYHHRSTVRKDDLSVLSAGICLDGQDRRFDLQSLAGVIREGRSSGELYEQ